ncbi:MAG: family 78 glycoside hydrolase catalytic domain [Bryobacterales bacterium]|nr:family 78 glycoside hydrolase catalytic domain [Bryobacterales bacterium]
MKKLLVAALGAFALLTAGCTAYGQAGRAVTGLTCEYLVNPLGIDVLQPRLSWMQAAGARRHGQSAYRVLVASSPEILRKDRGDLWDSGKVDSDQSTFVVYTGQPLTSGRRCYWKVRVWDRQGRASQYSEPAMWSMGVLEPAGWYGRWIGLPRPAGLKPGTPLPFPWLRKILPLKQPVREATAYVNAQGYYELYINGKKVDDHLLSPAVSDFSKRNLYVTHDVTGYLKPGDNSIALWLGRGWYVRGHPGVIHDGPLVRAQVEVTLADGSSVKVGTDATWKVRESPLTPLGKGTAFGDYGGERYDSRLELPGWNSIALDDSSWQSAELFDPPQVTTAAQMVEPNRIMETVKPVKVWEFSPGVYMMQMERNYTGWFEFRIPSGLAPGSVVRLEYADFPPSGTRFANNNQRDEIVVKGNEPQTFCSRFNYHAFGWVRITGLPKPPTLEDAKGYLIHTGYQSAADFESSDDLMNRIYSTVNWTYRCLSLGGYVVDCPHRERLGYGGDAGTSIETGMFNFATGGLYNRWSADWRAAQDPSGDLPYTAPNYQDQGGGGPMWCGFAVTLPWHLYLQYGDKRALETNYPTMRKWIEFAESKTVDGVMEFYQSFGMRMKEWNFLGDWVTPRRPGRPDISRDPQSARLINNLHYLYTVQLMAKVAAILDKKEDAARYQARAAALSKTLHQRFFDAGKNVYAGGEQPYLAFPLLLGVVPPQLRETVMRNLEHTILETNSGHIDAGMHGVYFLLKFLMEEDRNDLIYTMASKTDYPSWGDMLRQGATTIWENWSGGSHIHDTLISVGSWFIQGIGGIRIDEESPGFRRFVIKPAVVGGLTFARTRYRSPYGPIVSNWRLAEGTLHLDVTVPPGTAAAVHIPARSVEAVSEGGRLAARATGVRSSGMQGSKAVFEVDSGQYAFSVKFPG